MKFIKELAQSLFLLLILSIIFCFIYPMSIFLFSEIFFHHQANGSLIEKNNKIIGSKLLGQKFTSAYYFHGRPSFADYDGLHSSASNMGPTSKELLNSIESNTNKYRSINNLKSDVLIPIDAITYSASGLDPHITYQNALLQSARIAKSRNISVDKVLYFIEHHTESKTLLSRDRINVLELNMALDEKFSIKK